MRKAALIFMVCAMFAAVLLPTTAQALLQPGLMVNVRDGHAQMSDTTGPPAAEYHFTAMVWNGWSRSLHVTCNFRVSNNGDGYQGFPGTAANQWFADVSLSGRFRHGWTKVNMVARNDDANITQVTQWNGYKRGCFKGPNNNGGPVQLP